MQYARVVVVGAVVVVVTGSNTNTQLTLKLHSSISHTTKQPPH